MIDGVLIEVYFWLSIFFRRSIDLVTLNLILGILFLVMLRMVGNISFKVIFGL